MIYIWLYLIYCKVFMLSFKKNTIVFHKSVRPGVTFIYSLFNLGFACQTRGLTRDGTGVHDSIVNQLLTKVDKLAQLLWIICYRLMTNCVGNCWQIDGVEALNNILLIGMTNRKDLLDEALLRLVLCISHIMMFFAFCKMKQAIILHDVKPRLMILFVGLVVLRYKLR